MIKRALKAFPGILVFMLGMLAIVGWLAKIPIFLRPSSFYVPITFIGGFCFSLAGIALITFPFSNYVCRIIQLICGSLLLIIATLVLCEYIFYVDIGIDHVVDGSWLDFTTAYPGRISVPSAICFFLIGLIFILFHYAYKNFIAVLIEVCMFFLFTIITLSIIGLFLDFQILFSLTSYNNMSPYSRVAFILLCLFLWYFWRQSDFCYELYRGREDKKITLLCVVLLLTVILVLGLASIAAFANQQINLITNIIHITPLILFAVLIGLLILRFEVIPLIKRMSRAEKELIQSNALLKKSEERYALAVRGSNAALWDWEVGTDHIFYSPYLKNMLGYTDEELPNSFRVFEERIHPDDLHKVNEAIREHILHHVPYNLEYRLKRKSGEYHWFHAVGQAKWESNGYATRMAGSISDVTERKIYEKRLIMQYSVTQTLSESRTLHEAISETIRIICTGLKWNYGAIWLANDEKNKLMYLSSWYKSGKGVEEFLKSRKNIKFTMDKGVLGRVWSTRKPYWFSDITKTSGFLLRQEAINANFNSGFYFPMLLQNNVFGVMEFYSGEIELPDEKLLQMMAAIGPQISQYIQRKHVENVLRQSEAHKSAILNSASDGIFTITDKGSIVSFNLQTEKMFGYAEHELKNKNINDLIPGVTNRAEEIVNKLPVEFIGVSSKGKNFPAEITLSGMRMNKKNIFVIVVRDITERKKIEKLKNEFVSVVSHELRTPLTSIRGSLGLMLGGVVGTFSEKVTNLLTIANNNCERLLHLINDILDVEKIESGKMSFNLIPVDIAKMTKEAIAANQMYGEKFGVKIVLVESVSDVMVNVDFDRMLQVMANLISNAVKFSVSGEPVEIAIKVLNQKVRVSITNYGEGIPEDFQSLMFQKFSQADATPTRGKGGTGLGLNITKSIVEKMGGTINFISNNKETTFYFDFPVWIKDKNIKEITNQTHVATNRTLLVCEDDEDQAQYIKAMLESAGIHVDIAATVGSARNFLLKNEYQGLLLDLILPDQDGISFIRELRSQPKTRKLPIIVMSVIAKTGHALLNGDAISVLDWLDKPIDFGKLLKDVTAIKNKNEHIPKIMHVEDDAETRSMVKTLLQNTADIVAAATLQEAKIKLVRERVELVILDLILPDGKGTELLPLLAKLEIPVIVFSAGELDHEHAEFVKNSLIKSETSQEKLLKTIEKIIKNSSARGI